VVNAAACTPDRSGAAQRRARPPQEHFSSAVNALFEEMLAGMGGDMGAGADVKIAHLGDREEEWAAAAEEEATPVPKQRLTHAERKERAMVRPAPPPLRPPASPPLRPPTLPLPPHTSWPGGNVTRQCFTSLPNEGGTEDIVV
jgi:hypothetical protein